MGDAGIQKPDAARGTLLPSLFAWFLAIDLLIACAVTLYLMDRPPICPCGTVKLWHGVVQSNQNSQQITDWYSFSHVTHGLIMYAAAWLLWVRLKLLGGSLQRWALPIAVVIEAAWEIVENTPMIIDRYREATIALGYSRDSILNSMSDIMMCAIGFLAARRLPWWASVLTVAVLELVPLIVIRDNLTLNIWMLLAPNDAILAWQAGA